MTYYSEPVPFTSLAGVDRRAINGRLRPTSNGLNTALIGSPRRVYDDRCREPENPAFLALLETADLGPFRATGIRPALRALRAVMADVAEQSPEVYRRLSTSGMLCCRLARGSQTISNHSWGIAIDLKINGIADTRGDDCVQRGLLEIAPIFARHLFYWGAAFPMEESMHFEASEQLIRLWSARGELPARQDRHVPPPPFKSGQGDWDWAPGHEGLPALEARARAERYIRARGRVGA